MKSSKQGNIAPVTIIMPTYNRATVIAQSINSLLDQSMPAAELIVVVDGSTDNTVEILKGFGSKIKVIEKENGGKSSALNVGIKNASQPYIWIFDDDDIACADALERLYAPFEKDPSLSISYGSLKKFYGEWPSGTLHDTHCYMSSNRKALYIRLLQDFFIWQGAMLVSAQCYQEVGEFNPEFARSQDYEMALRLFRKYRSRAVPYTIFYQRHHSGDRGPKTQRFKAANSEKMWAKFNLILFDTIYRTHALEEFVITSTKGELTERERVTATIQRAAIMSRKGLWSHAVEDFCKAAMLAKNAGVKELTSEEASVLRRVFEKGARSTFKGFREPLSYRRALNSFEEPMRSAILGNLFLPVTYRLKLLPKSKTWKSEFAQMARTVPALIGGKGMIVEYIRARQNDLRNYAVKPMIV